MTRNLKRDDSSCKWSSERTPKLSPPPLWWEHKNEKEKFTPWCTINRRQRRGKANKSGGKRDTKLQLNTGVNGWEFARARRDFSKPSSATGVSGEGGVREGGRDGGTEGRRERGVIYWHLSGMNRSKARPDDRWSIRRQIKDGNCPLKLSSSTHSLPGLWNNL